MSGIQPPQQPMQTPDPNDLSTILSPLFSLFSLPQIESLLYVYLPTRIEKYVHKTGLYAVDTFVVTASVTLVLVFVKLIMKGLQTLRHPKKKSQKKSDALEISVIIEPTHVDDYHSTPNIYHQALSHLISENAQNNVSGYYRLKPNLEIDHDDAMPPQFNMVPLPNQTHTISDSGHDFQVTFQTSHSNSNDSSTLSSKDSTSMLPGSDYSKPGIIRSSNSNEPHICVTVSSPKKKHITVSTISSFLERITQDYITYTESLKKKSRSRYDYSISGKWARICSLYEVQGLDTVALCPKNEALIHEDLNSFKSNKPFYKRIGFPYRRGYLLHGPPGTGKTSLVFAIASELKRDLYFMNLSYIDSDSELFQAFANVPPNSIVVFEDVDTMSTSLHKRQKSQPPLIQENGEDSRKFNLSTFLSILDGHTLEDGIMFIMTTNHKERLDPAIIRPGRMDIHLDLTYATWYQMRRIYKMIVEEDDMSDLDSIYPNLEKEMPEFIIPPSEIMQIMVLCRNNRKDIPKKLQKLAKKYASS